MIFRERFDIVEAGDGQAALDCLMKEQDNLSIILLDIHMPIMGGFDVLKELNTNRLIKKIPVILITGDDSSDSERVGYEYGVSDIIQKPFDPQVVLARVNNVVELYQHKNHLEELVKEQTNQITKQAEKIRQTNNHIIDTLSSIVESRNLESGRHIKKIRQFTKVLLNSIMGYYPEYELTDELIEVISSASAMHDVGKIAIPDNILLKPGRLTPDEFEVMKTHTIKGCEIIDTVASIQGEEEFYNFCYEICRYHHERYDGNGYPDGIAGDDIPIAAQAVAIADVYDALVSERVYKEAYSKDTAFHMIMNGECGIFSPKVLTCFQMARKEFEELAIENADITEA